MILVFRTDIEIYAMLLAQKPTHVTVLRRVATLLAEDEDHRNEDVASRSRLGLYLALAAFLRALRTQPLGLFRFVVSISSGSRTM